MSAAATSRRLKLAIVGASGTVGARLVELIDERRFPYAELKLFGGADSSTESVEDSERDYPVHALSDPDELGAFDVAFLAMPEAGAAEIIEARPGPILIDLSGAGRSLSHASLAAPGFTPREKVPELAARGVLAIPYPAAHALATILHALEARAEFVGATIILGASSGGREAIAGLIQQSADLMNGRLDLGEGETQLAFNLFAHERANEIAREISSQVAALLGYAPSMVAQVVQAPTLHGTALAVLIPAARDGASAREKLIAAPGLLLVEQEGSEFRGVVDAVGEEAILVRLCEQPAGIALWCLFDAARLAALSALWVAENLVAIGGSPLA